MAAVLTEPETAKAAVLGADMIRMSVPIEKAEDTEDINPVDGTPDIWLTGKATDGTLDSDLQVVDPDASLRWLKAWSDTKGNIRMQHDPKRPVGHGFQVRGHQIKALVSDPLAKHFVRKRVLNDFSIGIINPDVRVGDPRFRHLDPMGKAVNGIITDRADGTTGLGEISVVDRGANYGASFSLVKAAAGGEPEWTGTWTSEPPAEDAAPETVTLTLPAKMPFRITPRNLAKLDTLSRHLALQGAAIKQAAVPRAEPAMLTKAAEPDAEKARLKDSARESMPAGDFAYVDSKGGKHLPVHDEGHVHSALGRFAQQEFESPAARRKAARKIVSRARGMGMDLAEHGNVVEAAGGKSKASKSAAAVPDVTKCMKCDGTGMADGAPCPDCEEGKKAAKAAAALDAAVTAPVTAEKKRKVMCGHCGAIQNIKHSHCPECGNQLHPGAMPVPKVKKNHDFACMGCGHDLDKGEKFCPGCGRENPGYLEVADHKIPMNEDKAAKERVSTEPDVTKGSKKKAGKKGGKNPFGGKQAPAFGKEAEEPDGKDAKSEKRRKGKGKGRSPAEGVKGQETMPLPAHREPDGPPVEAFEGTTHLEDGDHEMKTARRHKSSGLPPHLAVLHDLTCPAFDPADVTKSLPYASFATIDTQWFLDETLKAASSSNVATAREQWEQARVLSQAAVTLKTADPQILHRVRLAGHQAFLDANPEIGKTFRDATPGPGSAPTPGHVMPGAFRRPYLSAGHASESPQSTGMRSFPVPQNHPEGADFTGGYISAGHAAESPMNGPRMTPVPESGTGMRSVAGEAASLQARDYEHARAAMHDHVSRIAPGMCPMSPEPPGTQKPAPEVPAAVGAPVPHAAGKAAKPSKAEKAAAKAKQAARAAQAKARKAKRAARQQRRIDKAVAAGIAQQAPQPVADDAAAEPAQMTPEAFAAAVKAATAPMAKRLKAQDKALRKLAKTTDAIAGQPDTTSAPYRGAGGPVFKTSAAPAGPQTPEEASVIARTGYLQRLYRDFRESPNPEVREAAYKEYTAQIGITPMTGNEPVTHPYRT